jgi:hypothetical protein
MKELVYPAVLWVLFAGVAQAQDAAKLAQLLVERSGVAVQLQAVPKTFTDQIPQLRGQLPDDLLLALTDAGREAYRPELMAKEIAQSLAESLKPAEMQKAIAWLETGVGRRVTLAEERASASMDDASLKRYAEQTKNQLPSSRRQKAIQDLIEVTGSLEFTAKLMEGTALGMAIGMDSSQPVQKRVGVAFLRKQIEKMMPRDQLKETLAQAMPGMFGYTYREVNDADLEAYAAFLRSSNGKRVNDAIADAFGQAMIAASVRVGQLVDQRAPKRPV